MKEQTIFQVGDVHYPDHQDPDADIKDPDIDGSLITAATAHQLQAAARALLDAMDAHPPSLLAFTGDLTSRGLMPDYSLCAEFLDDAFLLSNPSRWQQSQLHVVPGNHDIDRTVAAAAVPGDLLSKFAPLETIWGGLGLNIIATADVRNTTITEDNTTVHAFGLNSCLGCGESRNVPEFVQEIVGKALDSAGITDPTIEAVVRTAIAGATETIDAPAYSEVDINSIYHSIQKDPPEAIAVIVAHHNLLQQAETRIDLYTDLLNGGMARSRLSSLRVPILYLHGHIHSDPVESVAQYYPDNGTIICISAPEFREGFNRIDVTFNGDGTPIGCTVVRYRVRKHGGTTEESPIWVRFLAAEQSISTLGSEVAIQLLRVPDCSTIDAMRRLLRRTEAELSDEELAEALKEAEWLGLVEILNRHKSFSSWRLLAVNRDD